MSAQTPNVLMVHNHYQIPGGEDTVVENETKLLEEHGHKVVLYTRHNNELKQLSLLQKVSLPFRTIFNLHTYREIKKIIAQEKIDVVHVHNTLNLISPAVYYAALACHIPVVQTIHNFRLLCPAATFYRDGHICEDCLQKGMRCALKHGCYRGSKLQTLLCVINTKVHRLTGVYKKIHYICLTEFNKQKLLEHGQIKPEQIVVKPNFVNRTQKLIPYAQRENQIVFVGRLDRLKGVDVLLKAWELLADEAPQLLICGMGPIEAWCKDFIEEHQLKNVILKGFVPNDEVQMMIGGAKALILPTQWYEGFPMTIVEAYVVGTPVLTSNMGNAASLIIPHETGEVFRWDDSQAVAETVRLFLSNNEQDYSKAVERYYERHLTQELNYQLFQEIYAAK